MKKLYWKPGKISWKIHLVIALISVIGIFSVETFKLKIKTPYYNQKVKAARIMKTAMDVLKEYRIKNIMPIDTEIDPTNSGMIGTLMSPITSNTGFLPAKQTTINPNWAAVIVDMLIKANVKENDVIAVAFSGSFPLMNLAVLSACESMNVKVVSISSLAGSTWGANIPGFSWLDMENVLFENRIIKQKSVAASLGGSRDRALGITKEGRDILKNTIQKYNLVFIDEKEEKNNIDRRIEIYKSFAKDVNISAFINVGGGTISVGSSVGKKLFKPGVTLHPSHQALSIDSIMSRFGKEGVPIINITAIEQLAMKYKFPITPTSIPAAGEGDFFSKNEYNKKLVLGLLLLIIFMLVVFIKMDIGYRIFNAKKASKSSSPGQMV